MNDLIVLSNAGLTKGDDETFFHFATRAAAEHERRCDLNQAQLWRDARWEHFERVIAICPVLRTLGKS